MRQDSPILICSRSIWFKILMVVALATLAYGFATTFDFSQFPFIWLIWGLFAFDMIETCADVYVYEWGIQAKSLIWTRTFLWQDLRKFTYSNSRWANPKLEIYSRRKILIPALMVNRWQKNCDALIEILEQHVRKTLL